MSIHTKNFYLTDAEMEQAMTLLKFEWETLLLMLGIIVSTQDLGEIVCLVERLGHSKQDGFLDEMESIGKSVHWEMLEKLKPIICIDLDYCKQIAIRGYGDPRELISDLAEILNSDKARSAKVVMTNKSQTVLCSVLAARSDLNGLCKCIDEQGPSTEQ